MTEAISSSVGCPTERAVARVLLYFEVFSYPLTAMEVSEYTAQPGNTLAAITDKLEELVLRRKVFRFGQFYQMQNDPAWVPRRLDCNRRASRLLPVAQRIARFIGAFPYVKGVFISGSLSKHCMRADSDIDFFLITEPGRLWLARTFLVFFKKIFLLNSHKYFCVNYFIDTAHLEIEEKNLFTATEIVTLLPMYGREWYHRFFEANRWAWKHFPNFEPRPVAVVPLSSRGFIKKMFELLFNGTAGDWLDQKAMQMTVRYWKKKFKHFDREKFNVALKSSRYVSKHHPLHFQEKVLKAFEVRVKETGF